MPGVIITELQRHLPFEQQKQFGMYNEDGTKSTDPKYKTVVQGAATTIFACVAPELENRGGLYLNDCHICRVGDVKEVEAGMATFHFPDVVADYAVDEEKAEKLWQISEKTVAK